MVTHSDLLEIEADTSILSSQLENDTSDEEWDDGNNINLSYENMVYILKDGFVGYSLTDDSTAPEFINDRGYSWLYKAPTYDDYCAVRNNRCCWKIEADWLYTNGYYNYCYSPDGYQLKSVDIYGGGITPFWGQVGSYQLHMKVKYRLASHKSLIYTNEF
ncbi:hypothetical protein [Reichenbachiella ulvae]|uniref:Uncharacterized protein n=1 Tax=Reichenbachiella ulvae TaxID=2980104 RepID=A0ABT3CZI9_9BACT|nr:hypothetical protein [Reichenbachiella ulvae]MCV9388905.1 hypothetical protein [Reichenbachiella ulvae]